MPSRRRPPLRIRCSAAAGRRFVLHPRGVSPALRLTAAALAVAAAMQGHAAQPLPSGTLPVSSIPVTAGNVADSGHATITLGNRTLTVDQTTQRAIIDWQSFNIAADAAVRFNQPNSTSAVLNRIHSADPSVIQGRLSANGDVYLVNANGILFGTGSQVDVGGLIASTLGMNANLFNAGLLTNAAPARVPALAAEGTTAGAVVIETDARITAASGGRLLFAGRDITNAGTLSAPQGQVVLAAGTKVYLAASQDPQLRGLLVEVDNGGTATNAAGASITADRGNVSIVGLAVNQNGRITAGSSVSLNGSVRLIARDTVATKQVAGVDTPVGSRYGALTLAAGSRIEVRPDTTDRTEIPDSTAVNGGRVELGGATVHIQGANAAGGVAGARVEVPAGSIVVTAQQGLDFAGQSGSPVAGVRVLVDDGAVLDVAGLKDVAAPMSRHQLVVELRGNELRDAPLVRSSPLRGKTVYIDAREGTPLADISGYAAQIRRTVAERSVTGGTIRVQSEGDVVVRQGATLDVSGGSTQYASGTLRVTSLVTADGRVVGIGEASADQRYADVASEFTRVDAKWGTRVSGARDGRSFQGYVEGGSAGTIAVQSPVAVLDGNLRGSTVAGPYQTTAGRVPLGGRLVLGGEALVQPLLYHPASETSTETIAVRVAGVTFDRARNVLAGPLSLGDALPGSVAAAGTLLDPRGLADAGFNRIAVDANGTVRIARGSAVTVAASSLDTTSGRQTASVSLAGRRLEIDGDIVVPAGSIQLTSQITVPVTTTLSDYGVRVGSGVTVAARGLWTNAGALSPTASVLAPVLTDGGSITVVSAGDIVLQRNSVLDVTAGGAIDAAGDFAGGSGGAIRLRTGRVGLAEGVAQPSTLTLDGTLRGYGFRDGGSLSVQTSVVTLGARRTTDARELVLSPEFFTSGGFADYAIGGHDGLTVASGTAIAPRTTLLQLRTAARTAGHAGDVLAAIPGLPGSGAIAGLAEEAPVGVRPAADLTLTAGSQSFGELVVERGARIETDPGGAIVLEAGRQVTVAGALVAPGGSVRVGITFDRDLATLYQYLPGQSVWLAAGSRIDTAGVFVPDVQTTPGIVTGTVRAGGSVVLSAGRGFVIAEAGATVDVSGTVAQVDVSTVAGTRTALARTTVASSAGSIVLEAREGVLFGGTLRAQPGAAAARGGSLAVTLLPAIVGNPAFPTLPERTILVAESGNPVPAGLRPGDAVSLTHVAVVRPSTLRESGVDTLALTTPDAVRFEGSVDLDLRSGFSLDARVVRGAAGSAVSVTAGHIALSSTSGLTAITPSAGSATLRLAGDRVDVSGTVALSGFSTATLASSGDIQLSGWYDQTRVLPADTVPTLAGQLSAAGTLRLGAARVYPSSASDFTLKADRVEFYRTGPADGPLLTAGGSLTVTASTIASGTTLAAPFGSITLAADAGLTLLDGSVTTVSGNGLEVPFGMTRQSGREWIYVLDADANVSRVFTAPPTRQVVLRGRDIDVRAGATIDASGGGDMKAYEFVPGPGGSTDVLAAGNGSFALVPTLGTAYAPYDFQEYAAGADTGVVAGARITLGGSDLLPAGTYTVLPARYALLPGAVLVTPVAGATAYGTQAAQSLADGSVVVSGRLGTALAGGATAGDAAVGRFRLQDGRVLSDPLRTPSEFLVSSATTFFADDVGLRPADAGRVEISPTASLALAGALRAAAGAGGRGGLIDITADRIVIDDGGPSDADGVHLSSAMLNGVNARSLAIGARREVRDGATWLVPVASSVTVRQAATPLAGADLLFVAKDGVTIGDGAVVRGTAADAAPGDLRIAANADGTMARGALVRIGGGDTAALVREGTVASAAASASVVVGNAVLSGPALQLDATGDVRLAAGATVAADRLAFGASRITVGSAGSAVPGLVLDRAALAQAAGASRLVLRSDSTVDFAGSVTLAARRLELDAPTVRFLGGSGDTVSWQAGTILLSATGSGAAATATAGGVQLAVLADEVVSGAGTRSFTGLAGSRWTVTRDVRFTGEGALTLAGAVAIEARAVTVAAGASQSLRASGGALAVTRHAAAALAPDTDLPDAQDAPAASLTLEGAGLVFDGVADLRGGSLVLSSTAGGLDVGSAARILAGGRTHGFGSTSVLTDGGTVTLASAGDVTVAAGARIDVGAVAGGRAGTLRVDAAAGTLRLDGEVTASGAAAGAGGRFIADLARLADFAGLESRLAAGRFDAERTLRVRTGDLAVGTGVTVTAHAIALSADAGTVTLAGTLDASGVQAGTIAVYAGRDLVATGATLRAAATGADRDGGSIVLGSGDTGTLTIAGRTAFDVSAASGSGGTVLLRAARTASGTDVRIATGIDATFTGAGEVLVEGVRIYTGVRTLDLTGTGSGGRLGLNTVLTDSAAFAARRDAVLARLGLATRSEAQLRPGVEVRSDADLTLAADWNLARDGTSSAGFLTIRAAGGVHLQKSLSDGFVTVPDDPAYPGGASYQSTDWTTTDQQAWSYRIAAGADLGAADPLGLQALSTLTRTGGGDLKIDGLVRTGTGFIELAAGRDFRLTGAGADVYTAGRADPTATAAASQFFIASEFTDQGVAQGLDPLSTLVAESPVFLVRGGHLAVTAQRDAIGHDSGQYVADWLYTRTLSVSGASATGAVSANDYFGSEGATAAGILNPQTGWWPRIRVFDQGLGTLGGGNLTVRAGRDVVDLSAVVATSGRVEGPAGTAPTASDLVVTGGGDLALSAGRDVVRGVYYVGRGDGAVAAGRDVTAGTGDTGLVLALGDAAIQVRAGRAAALETAFNPTLLPQPDWQRIDPNYLTNDPVEIARFSTYGARSAVDVQALTGTVQVRSTTSALAGRDPLLFGNGSEGLYLFPGTVRAAALAGDVVLNAPLAMAPSAVGNLELLAGGSVRFGSTIDMVENAGSRLPGVLTPSITFSVSTLVQTDQRGSAANFLLHSDPPLHADDLEPVRIVARTGSVVATGSIVTLPKAAEIQAGQDVLDLSLVGQNVRDSDVTRIGAGRDVVFRTIPRASGALQANTNSIKLGGPGTLEVLAGRDVDLGLSRDGITTRGNLDNPFLPDTGASIVIGASLGGATAGAVPPDYRRFWIETQLGQFAATLPAGDPARDAKLDAERTRIAAAYDALPAGRRESDARALFFDELQLSARDAVRTRDYSRGTTAISRLFPGASGSDTREDRPLSAADQAVLGPGVLPKPHTRPPDMPAGAINVFFSKVRTESGGDITLFAPGGAVNAGLATTSGLPRGQIDPAQLGIVTVAGGSIQAYARHDFLVNASRVFTLGGGDIVIWSALGDIDAGKGAKTAASTPPAQLKVDKDGRFVLDITQSVQGSGIGVLIAREGVKPGDVDLVAPNGEINAGDAGIVVAGNLTVVGDRVTGTDNIKVGGVSAGVPTVASGGTSGGLAGGNTSADATRTTNALSQLASNSVADVGKSMKMSFITVEVISFGGRN